MNFLSINEMIKPCCFGRGN